MHKKHQRPRKRVCQIRAKISPLLGWGATLSCAGRGIASPPAQPGLLVGEGPQKPPGCRRRRMAGIYRGSAGLLGRALCKQAPGGSPALESLRTNWNKGNLRRRGKGTKSRQVLFSRPPVAGGTRRWGDTPRPSRRRFTVGLGPPCPPGSPVTRRAVSSPWRREVWGDAR